MGGAAGHLMHLHDDLGLSFKEIKSVITKITEGRLEKVSEKLDGMNLVFTYDINRGQTKVARAASDIKRGGMDAAALAKKFAGRGGIELAFNVAFETLHGALASLSPQTTSQIFGSSSDRWYSMEIICTSEPNTINYDSNCIVIHSWPVYQVTSDFQIQTVDSDVEVLHLSREVERMQAISNVKGWHIRGPSSLHLKKLSEAVAVKAISIIDDAMLTAGATDDDTVYDYLCLVMRREIERLGLPQHVVCGLAERAATVHGAPSVPHLRKMVQPEHRQVVSSFVKASESLRRQFLRPIERAVNLVAVEVLRGLSSDLISEPKAEIVRLRSQVSKAVKAIEVSGNQIALDILRKEMSNLGGVENISCAVEGIVFFHEGQAYKLTGAFAPTHKILSLFKYGKKDIPKLGSLP
jgi:hypothetical protein